MTRLSKPLCQADVDMSHKTENDIVLAGEHLLSLILDFNTISFLEIHRQTNLFRATLKLSKIRPEKILVMNCMFRFVSEAEIAKKVPNVNRKRVVKTRDAKATQATQESEATEQQSGRQSTAHKAHKTYSCGCDEAPSIPLAVLCKIRIRKRLNPK